MELGWHKLLLKEEDMTAMSIGEILKRRNIERTWLVLFVYDRRFVPLPKDIPSKKLKSDQHELAKWETLDDRAK